MGRCLYSPCPVEGCNFSIKTGHAVFSTLSPARSSLSLLAAAFTLLFTGHRVRVRVCVCVRPGTPVSLVSPPRGALLFRRLSSLHGDPSVGQMGFGGRGGTIQKEAALEISRRITIKAAL